MAVREATKIKFSKREDTGKGTCRKLRAGGVVPAVFYGPEYKKSVVGTVSARDLSRVTDSPNWETSMIDLEMPDGKVEMALLRSVQRHAVTQNILHIDLYQLMKGHKVRVAIPIRVINKEICAGVKMGGVLEQPVREVEVLVLPREIPSEIIIDTVKMPMGSEIFTRDLELPESAELLSSAAAVVLMVTRPKVLTDAVSEESGEETAEVEVVGKGKRKEDEE
ncbi:MAG: 50S ribosomal protein L25 [Synergistaceae bacterium]|jgi:large subunit ribosomal protein L25|nr:50S ribosomal protein L25 [Synergistaceae bacterium]